MDLCGRICRFDQIIKDVKNKMWCISFKYQAEGVNKKDNFFTPIARITDKDGKLSKERALWYKLGVK
ncbi:hypothetical protein [Staphylococcus pseudintermedius]|uniref:hypothetical protein n=1 Tax=Staphylococcus pseudintermedius TaxID=283734 RepID=UPI00223C3752|nr:hypothetical protein [Staphylococcus pseudintermedius]